MLPSPLLFSPPSNPWIHSLLLLPNDKQHSLDLEPSELQINQRLVVLAAFVGADLQLALVSWKGVLKCVREMGGEDRSESLAVQADRTKKGKGISSGPEPEMEKENGQKRVGDKKGRTYIFSTAFACPPKASYSLTMTRVSLPEEAETLV